VECSTSLDMQLSVKAVEENNIMNTEEIVKLEASAEEVVSLEVDLGQPCPYFLGEGIVDYFPDYLQRFSYDKIIVVSSRVPDELFGNALFRALESHGINVIRLLIDDRESSKDWQTLSSLCEALITAGVTRDSILVALGGGVVGNVVGLAAGLVFRGIRYIEVPTTLMAQTDSVLSRKQAINGSTGKNQFGLYHTPLFIWSDVAYSRREPFRQTRSAVVEAIKNGLVNSPEWLEELTVMLQGGSNYIYQNFKQFTLRLIRSKLAILERDPTEKREAIILEYGHTFGHAIEWLSRGSVYHGEAVSIGMCTAAHLSFNLGLMKNDVLELHYYALRDLLGAPVQVPAELTPEQICHAMLNDNKRASSGLSCLLLEEPGRLHKPNGSYLIKISEEQALHALAAAATL
jgi:3-dehydroquinate synthase